MSSDAEKIQQVLDQINPKNRQLAGTVTKAFCPVQRLAVAEVLLAADSAGSFFPLLPRLKQILNFPDERFVQALTRICKEMQIRPT